MIRTVGCSRTSIVRWKNRLQEKFPFSNKRGSGRKSKLTPIIRKKIVRECKGKLKKSTRLVSQLLKRKNIANIPHSTVSRVLKKEGLRPYRQICKTKLTSDHIKQRLIWLKKTENVNWDQVVFSDEKMFYLSKPSNKKNDIIWDTNSSNLLTAQISQYPKKVHVWGAISSREKTDLAFIEGSLDSNKYIKILEKTLIPKMNELYNNKEWILMQDHATPHDSAITQAWMKQIVVNFLKRIVGSLNHLISIP